MNVSEKFFNQLVGFQQATPRLAKLTSQILDFLAGDADNPDFNGDYIALRPGDKVSYMPKNKTQQFCENGLWKKTGRQETTLGRFFTKFLPGSKPHEVKDFTEAFTNYIHSIRIEIWDNDRIEDAYARGPNSCMADKPVGKFHSGLKTRIAVVCDNNSVVARCILWEEVFISPGKPPIKAYDNIYAKDGSYDLVCRLEEFVRDQGYKNSDCLSSAIVKIYKPFGIHNTFLPYMDTFCYMDEDAKYLSNSEEIFFDPYELSNTDGSYDGHYDEDYDEDEDREFSIRNPVTGQYIYTTDYVRIDGFPYSRTDPTIKRNKVGEYSLTTA